MSKNKQLKYNIEKYHFFEQQNLIKAVLIEQQCLKNKKLQAENARKIADEKINQKIKPCRVKQGIHQKTRDKINEKIDLLMKSNARAKRDNEKIQITRCLIVQLLAEEGIGTTFKTVKPLFDLRALEIAEHHEQCGIDGIRFNYQYHGKNGLVTRAIELLGYVCSTQLIKIIS